MVNPDMPKSEGPVFLCRVLRQMPRGSSRPVVAQSENGEEYVLKMRHSMSNPFAAVCEFIASSLASALLLPVPTLYIARIEEQTDIQAVSDEMRDSLRKSFGINIATEYIRDAVELLSQPILPNNPLLRKLFLLDMVLLNIDRSGANTNLLYQGEKIFSFDYETSLTIIAALQGNEPMTTPLIIRTLRQSVLYTPDIGEEEIEEFATQLQGIDILSLFSGVPQEWLGKEMNVEREQRIVSIWQKARSKETIQELYAQITKVNPESPADYQKRVRANRSKFEQLLHTGERQQH